ncbi:hypothetical protein [Oceaniovalibus guishaninsula]|nr:hypothetical protein [Oceaniovalibus guishaninsula]
MDDSTFAERQELANTSVFLATPKSAGSTLTTAFKRFCLDGQQDSGSRAARLREAGYVPDGGWRKGFRAFVTNDTRPAVWISREDRLCAVRARAQTGQAAAIRKSIASWFPNARLLASGGAREIWQVGPGEGIATHRAPFGPHLNEITLARIQL